MLFERTEMESANQSQLPGSQPVTDILDVLSPLNTIRTETVLSKFPVHNLAKRGKVDIRIVKHGDSGAVQLKWEVSHSDRYGQPRQLAYKLDTLVVNRKLDEEGRPLPQIVRLGSLKDICRQLGMQESGKNTKDVRTAFLQNATAFINAQITYRTAEGVDRRLEAGFTRYGVIFTGEAMPDGRRADAVYITLNTPYWEVVNSAPVRPLDYDYLKALSPAAQRFYEVVSFRIYAALKNGWSVAKLSYSDYCAFSAQQRYFDHEHFRVQMYKIHKPHLESGYLKSVNVDLVTDREGKSDWLMNYTPGSKARAEFRVFTEKDQRRNQPAIQPPQSELMIALGGRGIGQTRAAELIHTTEADRIRDLLDWGDFILRQAKPGTFRNPPGFYVWLITEKITPPPDFEPSRLRESRVINEPTEEADSKQRRLQYEQWKENKVNQYIQSLDPVEYSQKIRAKQNELARAYGSLPGETLAEIARVALSADIEHSMNLPTFDTFSVEGLSPQSP